VIYLTARLLSGTMFFENGDILDEINSFAVSNNVLMSLGIGSEEDYGESFNMIIPFSIKN